MKTLVLCVDRDDDFGVKAGLNSPFIGREENLNAAMALGLRDAEDSDINTLLAAVSIYDEMIRKGMSVEMATICGDVDVGYESDLVLATQLETVLEITRPDRVVLVSDGAEDEYIYPMVSSRIKVDSVRKVYVKQAPTVEGTYYVLIKMLHDDKVRKRIVVPIGLVFFTFGVFSVLLPIMQYYINQENWVSYMSSAIWGVISLVLGVYLIAYAYKLAERLRSWSQETRQAVRSGSQLIPFAVLAVLLFLLGILYGVDAATVDPSAGFILQVQLFISGTLWMWVFAYFTYQIGMFINHFLSKGKITYTFLVASVTVFAVGFIVQGAMDATQIFLGYRSYDQVVVLLEIISGFLLAVFGGLLNTSLRSITGGEEAEKVEPTETSE